MQQKGFAKSPEVPQSNTPVDVYGYAGRQITYFSFKQKPMFPVYANNPYEFDRDVNSAFRVRFQNLFVLPYTYDDVSVPFGTTPRIGDIPVSAYHGRLADVLPAIQTDGYDGIALIFKDQNEWTSAINLTAEIERVTNVANV